MKKFFLLSIAAILFFADGYSQNVSVKMPVFPLNN